MLAARFIADGQASIPLNAKQITARNQILQKLASGDYLQESHDCLIFAKNDFDLVSEKDRYGLPVRVVACRNCGLLQTTPRLTEDSCRSFYDSEYRHLYVEAEHPTRSFFNRQVDQGEKIRYRVEQIIGKLPPRRTVVVVGCGAGGILVPFRARGCQVIGFDWGTNYLEFGRKEHGLDLRVGGLGALAATIQPDIVIYSHVLEHVPEPRAELALLRTLINQQGLVYIEVPGVKNMHQAYDGDLLRYLQNAHISHFSQQTLINLLQLEQFKPLFCNEHVDCICQPTSESSPTSVND